jgi:hypothetical protein
MDKIMERSMMQTLFKYLPGAYADFDIEGYSVTARIFGWNANKSTIENKSRIAYEIADRIQQYMHHNASKDIPNNNKVTEQNKFFDAVMTQGKDSFDLYCLNGKRDEEDKYPEIVSVVRPYVFYCTKCHLIHIITDFDLTESSNFLNNYKFRIREIFDHKKHRCMKCNGPLKQQQIIRIDAFGNAFDYEPKCEIHLHDTEYYIKKDTVFNYRCDKCEKTIDRKWNKMEKLTPALDPNAFFPHIVSILDTKDDNKIEEISKYQDLAKLLILREMDILTHEKYTHKKNELVSIQNEFQHNTQSLEYRRALIKSGISELIKMFNEPAFNTYAQNNPNAFYNNVGNRLIDITELQDKKSINKEGLLESIRIDADELEYNKTLSLLKKLMIEDIYVSENVPVTNVAYGYTRVSTEVGLDFPEQAILNLYKGDDNKYKFYSTKLFTEGVYLKFNAKDTLDWLKNNVLDINGGKIFVTTNDNPSLDFFNNYIRDNKGNEIITSVLHTISHIMIKEIAMASGLEVSSLSEMIFPEVLGIFIYSTSNEGVILNSIKTAISRRLYIILQNALSAIHVCSLKSICSAQNVSACLGCLFISELSCTMYNHNLNRKYLNAIEKNTMIGDNETIHIRKGLWV